MGIRVERMLSNNGSCYRSAVNSKTCTELGRRHIFTRPYRPHTNGKAERFIQTLTKPLGLRSHLWLLGRAHRGAARLGRSLQLQETTRLLGHKAPAARLAELEQRAE
jgi:transposase InsO family protein